MPLHFRRAIDEISTRQDPCRDEPLLRQPRVARQTWTGKPRSRRAACVSTEIVREPERIELVARPAGCWVDSEAVKPDLREHMIQGGLGAGNQ